ncbi:MAG: hypothetical protein ACE5KV_04980, partial [Thermoplasmata archaeon]
NLIGFPSFNYTYTTAYLKAETNAARVEGFDSSSPYFLKDMRSGDTLNAGFGYWIMVESDIVWIVDNT